MSKITGMTTENAKVYILNETTNEIEATQNITVGNYEVDTLSSGVKLVVAVSEDGKSLSYSNVLTDSNSACIQVGAKYAGVMSCDPSDNKAITNFTTSDSVIFYGGSTSIGTSCGFSDAAVFLTNEGTTVSATAYPGSTSESTNSFYEIVKFTGGVKSIQQGVRALNATPVDITINAVDLNNTVCFLSGWSVNSANRSYYANLVNSTTLRLTAGMFTDSGSNTAWNVLEFNPGIVESIQHGSVTAATTGTTTITAVDLSRSVLFYRGTPGIEASSAFNGRGVIWLSDASTVSMNRYTNYGSIAIHFDVVQFATGAIKSVQRGMTTLISGGECFSDILINKINRNKSVIVMTGRAVNEVNACRSLIGVSLLDDTHIRLQRSSSSIISKIGWQVVEFY